MSYSLLFFLACLAGVVAVQPYQLKILSGQVQTMQAAHPEKKTPPLAVMVLSSVIQADLLAAIAAFAGVPLANKVGLTWPLLAQWITGTPAPFTIGQILPIAVLSGALATGLILLADLPFKRLLKPKSEIKLPLWWEGLLAAFYGGIVEEVLLRLFFMSLILWGARSIGIAAVPAFWLADILAAVIFGAGHLPAASMMFNSSAALVIRTLLDNSIGGIIFGFLFWRYGFEAAVLAHFTADILLHVVFSPILYKWDKA
jgi:hypothetical protein